MKPLSVFLALWLTLQLPLNAQTATPAGPENAEPPVAQEVESDPAVSAPAVEHDDAKPKKSKRTANAAFMKPVTPDEKLAAVVGSKPLPRTELTKKLWDYIKKNKLQDAVNRRMINADEKLKAVFGGKKVVSMFEMTKTCCCTLEVSNAISSLMHKPMSERASLFLPNIARHNAYLTLPNTPKLTVIESSS
ncbi:MAG: hypothetical protein HC782_02290 [Gammaproteobacteria bacterium]|nr:hypothetical protein [Gammaproteobacteria bacterium]